MLFKGQLTEGKVLLDIFGQRLTVVVFLIVICSISNDMHGRCSSHLTHQKALRLILFSKTHWMFPAIAVDVYTGLIWALWRSKVSSMIHARPNCIRSLTATFVRLPLQWELCKVIMHIKSILPAHRKQSRYRGGLDTLLFTQPSRKLLKQRSWVLIPLVWRELYGAMCLCDSVMSCF